MAAPTVETTDATNVRQTRAVLNGTVDPNGKKATWWFERWKGAEPFESVARRFGAAYLLGPEDGEGPLANRGNLSGIPTAVLKNGAALSTPGMLTGAAQADLDGENDYIDTGWETRTNYNKTPTAENESGWSTSGANTLSYVTEPTLSGLTKSAKFTYQDTTALALLHGGNVPVPDEPIWGTVAIWVPEDFDGEVYVSLEQLVGSETLDTSNRNSTGKARGEWILLDMQVDPAAEDLLGQLRIRTLAGKTPSAGKHIFVGAALITKDRITSLDEIFPTPAQLEPFDASKPESGLAGWSGEPHESASDIGPFARGTKRAFAVWAKNDDPERAFAQTLFGSTVSRPICYIISGKVWFYTDTANVSWEIGTITDPTLFVLLHDPAAETAELYVDGESLGVKALAGDYPSPGGTLIIGHWGSSSDYWPGALLPFSTTLGTLTEAQVKELSEATALLADFHPADKEGDAGEGSEAVAVSEEVAGLIPGTEYHFRLYAENEDG